jgi:flagellar motor protein MotB
MKATLLAGLGFYGISAGAWLCVASAQTPGPQPIYRVTVVSRTLEAVNYQHQGGPTPIDFQGTVLMPRAKGTAIVENRRGSTSIDAKFDHLDAPTRYGREYLTYVLWAISPEGRPKNLGEVLVDSSDHAHVKVTTDLQAFGLILTAEPYYSVSIPSDVVVAENVVRPDTIGAREEVTAKYELMPRGEYTLNVQPAQLHYFGSEGPKVSYDRYEAVLELYQAENAVQIARSLGADQYAPETMSKAETLLSQAQNMDARRMDSGAIVSTAREAAQMAEDARTIAVKRSAQAQQAEQLQQGQVLQQRQQQAAAVAEADAARARAEEQAERARADAAEAHAQAVEQATLAPQPAPPATTVVPWNGSAEAQHELRALLLAQLGGTLTSRDTPRGIVVTVNESMWGAHGDLRPEAGQRLASVAAILAAHPGLTARVEGYDTTEAGSEEHAQAVRSALVAQGANPGAVVAIGYGDSRPIASSATAAGREQNRRVEIVISGNSIGARALWDRSYGLTSRR